MNTFYIVRHGQTIWNIKGQTQGHGDSSLTKMGFKQADELGCALKNKYNITKIFCSDLGRAVQTAETISKHLHLEVVKSKELREMGFGIWEGMKIKDIKTKYPDVFTKWRNEPDLVNIEGAENLAMIYKRVSMFIENLNKHFNDEHILLVSHSITVRILLLYFLDSDLKNIYRIKQDNTAINIVEYREYGPVMTKMNDTSHITMDYKINNSALE